MRRGTDDDRTRRKRRGWPTRPDGARTLGADGEAFEMENVRGARSNAGLRHQHVAATRAVAAVCDADVEGDEVGSETVRFEPGPVNAGDVEVTVGTAGNLTLVFDALLPVAYALDDTLTVAVEEAGTDVPHAPPIDYQRHAKLPLLREYGVDATVDVDKRGFYPDGGGAATLTLDPSDATALDLSSRDSIKRLAVYSVATTELRAAEVAHRQAAHVENALDLDVEIEANADYVGAPPPGRCSSSSPSTSTPGPASLDSGSVALLGVGRRLGRPGLPRLPP
ncbi:RNA 3'-terminal phosphate cyclase [Halospeciosus flavus]|uniref:RNA 3'-terminal phosphate cyclase n=1 Tax=Halospeciosus flavus TaxID=3032283 RepID=UPI00361019D1